MKIYTEINYKWLDGKLVETDSKSFEYEGNLTLCAGDGGVVETVTAAVTDTTTAATEVATSV
ncbi:uncharacterized protein METZ01_LOCUS213738, partial [marine metagenome]